MNIVASTNKNNPRNNDLFDINSLAFKFFDPNLRNNEPKAPNTVDITANANVHNSTISSTEPYEGDTSDNKCNAEPILHGYAFT